MIRRRPDGEDDARPLALGPTGRPLNPVGALFEAAFRRFGQRMGAYLLYSVVCAAPTGIAAWWISTTDIGGAGAYFGVLLPFFLGHLALIGILAGLVTGELRARAQSIAIAVIAGAVILAVVGTLLPPLALIPYPFMVFGPIAAAAGDADGLSALLRGAALAARNLGRAALVVFGLLLLGLFFWFGFVIALSPLEPNARKALSSGAVILLIWPVAALVLRNLYGDLTGRLVIHEAQGEAARQADLERRGRRRS
jgi:hypothetical protein